MSETETDHSLQAWVSILPEDDPAQTEYRETLAELTRLREALVRFVSSLQPDGPDQRTITVNADELKAALRIARAALSPAEKGEA